MRLRIILLVSVLMAMANTSIAQQTALHQPAYSTYLLAIENLAQGHTTLALQQFEILDLSDVALKNEVENIQYNKALCSSMLNAPGADFSWIEYINTYPNSDHIDQAYFYIAKAAFNKKEYETALFYQQKIYESRLSYEQAEEMAFQKGYGLFTKKKLDEALAEMQTVNANPKSVYYDDANYYIGFINYKNEKLSEALTSFQKIDKNEKYRKIVPYYIVNIQSSLGNDDAVISYGKLIENEKDILYKLELNYVIGQTYFRQKKYSESIPYLEPYVKQSQKVRKEDVYQLAFTQYQLQRYDDAIQNFNQLTNVNDTLGQNALYHLGDCYVRNQQKDKAFNAFLSASKQDYNLSLKKESHYLAARIATELGQQKTALDLLKGYIKSYPNDAKINDCKESITDIYLNSNNYDEAIKAMDEMPDKSMRIQKAYQKITFTKATQLYNNLRQDEALVYFEKSSKYPIDSKLENETSFWKGEINYIKKKYEIASQNYQKYLNNSSITAIQNGASEYTARYALAYCNLKKERYGEALNQFERLRSIYENAEAKYQGDASLIKLNNDAVLRLADCQFSMRDYSGASYNYQKTINEKANGTPYALYQDAIIKGLTGDALGKTNNLMRLTTDYPKSLFVDDALLELGKMNGEMLRTDEAIKYYNQLLVAYPASPLVGKCKNSLALIYTNQNNETKAKEMYKDVIATNPKSDDSKEAMVGLRNIYIDEANPNEYINYLANNANVVLNETAKDSLLFEAAETQYLQNNCEQAVAGFDSYLSQFANGVFALNSHYYRSDCYFNQKNYTQASIDYDWILAKPDNTFTEKSLLKAASIAYNETFDYEKAYQYYKRLLAISAYKENIALAKKGLLHTSFMLNKTTETIELANALLGENDASNDELTVIYYYLGKCYLNQNETSIALGQFKRMENYTINKYTAEGQYLIAKIMMESGELETAEKQCMYVADTYASYEYWVVKSYILLGDIYVKNKDYFQAKATYQSIVDGYDGDKNLVEECRAKIANIEANESKTNRIIDPSDTQPIIENNDNSNNNEK